MSAADVGGTFGEVVAVLLPYLQPIRSLTLSLLCRLPRRAVLRHTGGGLVPEVERNADGTRRHGIRPSLDRTVPERTAQTTSNRRHDVIHKHSGQPVHRLSPLLHRRWQSLEMGWGVSIGFEVSGIRDYIDVRLTQLSRKS